MKDERKTFFGYQIPAISKMSIAVATLRVMCKEQYPAEAVEGILDIINKLQAKELVARKCA